MLLKAVALAAIFGLIALLVWGTLAAGKGKGLVARVARGETPLAPDFDLELVWPDTRTWPSDLRPAAGARRLAMKQLRGRPVVLNFWASWCIPCRKEAPLLNAAAEHNRGKVVFLGVDIQDLRSDALGFLDEFDVGYPSVRDEADTVYRAYGLTGVPETYYLDSGGRIVAHSPGPVSLTSLEVNVQAAIAGGAAP